MIEKKTETSVSIKYQNDFPFLEVATVDIILEDGKRIGTGDRHRSVLTPVSNLENQSEAVKAVANVYYTEDIKQAFKEHLQKLENNV